MEFIKTVSEDPGGRIAGSEEEKKAADIFANKAKEIIPDSIVIRESFMVSPMAFVAWIRPFSIFMFVGIIVENKIPLYSLFVAVVALILSICHILRYNHVFDFMFPKRESSNVIIEKNFGRSERPLVIMLSGHLDSAYSWPALETFPTHIRQIAFVGVSGVLTMILMSSLIVFKIKVAFWIYATVVIYQTIAAICLYSFISLDSSIASPGASDNASALGISLAVAKYFADKRMSNLHLVLVGFGSEETGLNGSISFMKRHGLAMDQLKAERRFYQINLDTIAQLDHVHVPAGEKFLKVPYSEELLTLLTEGYRQRGVGASTKLLDIGGVDSIPIADNGNEAINISCVNYENPSFYHSMKDGIENVEPDCISSTIHAIIYTIENLHSKHLRKLKVREELQCDKK